MVTTMNQHVYWPGVALSKRIELAISLINSDGFVEYDKLSRQSIRECAKASALSRTPLWSPLIENIRELRITYYPWLNLGWCFERDYWIHHPDLQPSDYFSISLENGFVSIESKKISGGRGWLSLQPSMVHRVFSIATKSLPDQDDDPYYDQYPVGGKCRFLLRRWSSCTCSSCDCDSCTCGSCACGSNMSVDNGLFLDPDTHPNRGYMCFGSTDQDIKQLAAFCRLQPIALQLLEDAKLTKVDRETAAKRVSAFRMHSPLRFMPESGFCSRCDRDVSVLLDSNNRGYDPTGCPFCCASWCD